MPRLRLGVALLVPGPAAGEVDGLRRALGDGSRPRIPAHLTLVPPVNVPAERLADALRVLRSAAAGSGPLRLRLGPPATFHPVTPVVYLAVGGDVDGLAALRDRVFRPPLARALTHPFVPHVTLADELAPERIPAALAALADARLDVTIDRVHLLREEPGRIWRPIADAPLAAATVVGRGGLPLELTVGEHPDPEATRLLAWPAALPPAGGPETGASLGAPAPGDGDRAGAGSPDVGSRAGGLGTGGRGTGGRGTGDLGTGGLGTGDVGTGGQGSGDVGIGGVGAGDVGTGGRWSGGVGIGGVGAGGPVVRPLAVAARRDGEVVGAAHGWTVGPLGVPAPAGREGDTVRDGPGPAAGGAEEVLGAGPGRAAGGVGALTRVAWLVVAEGARRQGVGAHLLAAVEAEARSRGSAGLETAAPDSPAVTALLSGAGWRPADLAGAPLPGWRWWHRPLSGSRD